MSSPRLNSVSPLNESTVRTAYQLLAYYESKSIYVHLLTETALDTVQFIAFHYTTTDSRPSEPPEDSDRRRGRSAELETPSHSQNWVTDRSEIYQTLKSFNLNTKTIRDLPNFQI